ncbi:hypothetical protein COO60DRAFT_1035218 [Scenedesmus sp. NREL 46B-D3]|nr:hypothetical protein COO60DRAFT_1035218 [Scenedesmus sp. NREL 46B-D3]
MLRHTVLQCAGLYSIHLKIHSASSHIVRSCTSGPSSSFSCSSSRQHSTVVRPADMAVDVTRENFQKLLPTIKEALERCTFYSFDCEMTGLFTDGNKHEYLDDIQSRYTKMTESSKAYIITQYGLSCFEATGPGAYEARTFNFYLFPQPHGGYNRRFLCDASSLVFLASHGFDFNRCISQGVPYMPVRTRDFQLLQVNRSNEPRGDPVVASSANDQAFVAQLVETVADWLAGRPPSPSSSALNSKLEEAVTAVQEDAMGSGPDDAQEPAATAAAGVQQQQEQQQQQQELALPPLNSYKRLLAFQELRKPQFGVEGHPGFWVKRLPDSRFLVLVRASAQQAEQHEAEARAARIAAIHEAAGFAAVFDLMRRSNKPAVGHNCLFDVSYGLYGFADSFLPSTWRDFKKMARSWHPGGIWDTKYIARQLPEVFQGSTSLAEVYSALVEDGHAGDTQALLAAASAAAGCPVTLPNISHAPGFDKYRALGAGEAAHEAGYDAYMTGAAFACLLPLVAGKIAAEPSSGLAVAQRAALERSAAAAAAKAARAAGVATPEAGALQQTPPPTPAPQQLQPAPQQQQQQQLLAEPQRTPLLQQTQQQQLQPQLPGGLLQYVQGVAGRLNITFSDIPYAALSEEDPIPDRPCTFHLSGLQPGYRLDDIWRMLQRQGLGSVRRSTTPHPAGWLAGRGFVCVTCVVHVCQSTRLEQLLPTCWCHKEPARADTCQHCWTALQFIVQDRLCSQPWLHAPALKQHANMAFSCPSYVVHCVAMGGRRPVPAVPCCRRVSLHWTAAAAWPSSVQSLSMRWPMALPTWTAASLPCPGQSMH